MILVCNGRLAFLIVVMASCHLQWQNLVDEAYYLFEKSIELGLHYDYTSQREYQYMKSE